MAFEKMKGWKEGSIVHTIWQDTAQEPPLTVDYVMTPKSSTAPASESAYLTEGLEVIVGKETTFGHVANGDNSTFHSSDIKNLLHTYGDRITYLPPVIQGLLGAIPVTRVTLPGHPVQEC